MSKTLVKEVGVPTTQKKRAKRVVLGSVPASKTFFQQQGMFADGSRLEFGFQTGADGDKRVFIGGSSFEPMDFLLMLLNMARQLLEKPATKEEGKGEE